MYYGVRVIVAGKYYSGCGRSEDLESSREGFPTSRRSGGGTLVPELDQHPMYTNYTISSAPTCRHGLFFRADLSARALSCASALWLRRRRHQGDRCFTSCLQFAVRWRYGCATTSSERLYCIRGETTTTSYMLSHAAC